MNPKVGACCLCLSHNDLPESHFMPGAAYRLVQKSGGQPPVVIKSTVSIVSPRDIYSEMATG